MKRLLVLMIGALMFVSPVFAQADSNRGRQGGGVEDGILGLENPLDDRQAGRHGADDDLIGGDHRSSSKVRKVLKFDTMAPISGALVGTDLIRGVPGGGAPWMIESARGHLDETGKLEIDVKGLVLADSGTNPAESFRGLVSCMGADGLEGESFMTADFPTDLEGNATISEVLSFPGGCLAPIVFVTGPEGQWFAVTGAMLATAPVPEPVPAEPAPVDAAGTVPTTVDPAVTAITDIQGVIQ